MLRWFEENGRESDVVISSRVRLARNIRDYNFSLKLTDDDARKMVNDLTAEIGKLEAVKDYSSYDFARLDDYQKMAMKEDPTNIILMHAAGANVSGQIASVIAGGMVINLVSQFL